MNTAFNHIPVMLAQCLDGLNIRSDGVYCDCTVGGGGHSYEIARRLGENGRLIAFDRDFDALTAASARLAEFGGRVELIHTNFADASNALAGRGLDGALIDLGVSSYQLDNAERGFSYMSDAPLDMRMDKSSSLTARDIVNGYSERELARIIFDYGEDKYASRIAAAIVLARPIETTGELAAVIEAAVPKTFDRGGGHHPAKRTFQAIRIEVNGELDAIEPALRALIGALKAGGRLCVITFHSLEDRIVKQTFASEINPCTCPHDFPVCVCGKKPRVKAISRKPILPDEAEMKLNPRSKSAKLRIVEKLTD